MTTRFLLDFDMPVDFSEESFKEKVITTFRKKGIAINNLSRQNKDFSLLRTGDVLEYYLETDYNFGLEKLQSSVHYDYIMNKIKTVAEYYNYRNPEKININLVK